MITKITTSCALALAVLTGPAAAFGIKVPKAPSIDSIVQLPKIGDFVSTDFSKISDPKSYGQQSTDTLYKKGETLYKVDPETGKILEVIGTVSDLKK